MAKRDYETDMGRGYGVALTSMFIESSFLPGEDAEFVHQATGGLLYGALESTQPDKEVSNKTTERDAAVIEAISVGRMLGAKNAHEAAEMLLGREIGSQEWESMKGEWKKHWN